MKLERTTKKSNKTTVITETMDVSTWKGVTTLTAETSAEYFQVRMTADEARALIAQLQAMIGVA